MEIVKNRYEFAFLLSCQYANPNGDPDMGNMPRTDAETGIGCITDTAIKRRIRDYVELTHAGEPGMDVFVQSDINLNRKIAESKDVAGVQVSAKDKVSVGKGREKACAMYYDVRTFGGVLSTGPNAGQVRGPVQFEFGRSIDRVTPIDMSITCVAKAVGPKEDDKKQYTAADYQAYEDDASVGELHNMGRKAVIPFGLYLCKGYVSANLAEQTGFTEYDLSVLFEAIAHMYDQLRTASKNSLCVVGPLIIFKHFGTDSDSDVAARQAKLGNAPAHKLFELIEIKHNVGVEFPRCYRDYTCNVKLSARPRGVDVGFLLPYHDGNIVWNTIPSDEDWVTET